MDEKSLLTWRILCILSLILIPGLASCAPTVTSDSASKWLPSQVRALDPAESTPNPISQIDPTQDLIALYSRETSTELQIRLDLLELELNPQTGLHLNPTFDLHLALNFIAGDPACDWDFLITIPAEGEPTTNFPFGQPTAPLIPQIHFEPLLDSITIAIKRAALPDLRPGYSMHAILTAPGSAKILDEIPATQSSAKVEPVPLLLAFWNTLPAHTPAQALRRWDGAHTGPLGERHGLKHLLEASRDHQVPIVLLDLKAPTTLSALDLLGQTQNIAALQQSGLLILPETLPETYFGTLPGWAISRAAQSSRQIALNFGLAGSPFLFTPSLPIETPSTYALTFIRQSTPSSNQIAATRSILWQNQRFIPLPSTEEKALQATSQGLTIETRRALLQIGFGARFPGDLAVLGGDLAHSTFGDPQAAQATLRYIAGHPWLQVLTTAELQTLPACAECTPPVPEPSAPFESPVMTALQIAPRNAISALAWQMFLDLSAPATPAIPELAELRAAYLGEIGNLLAAAEWQSTIENQSQTNNPATRSEIWVDCSADTDFDNQAECALANADYFALLDSDGGRLVLFFARTSQGITQLVGPGSQLVVGLSDYRQWDLAAGALADPANVPGAMAGPWSDYEVELLENGVRFTTAGVEKIFRLSANGLRVELHSDQPQTYQIPLVVAPETRFTSGWATQYRGSESPQGWIWGIKNGPKVEVKTSGGLTSHNFQESGSLLVAPENPNLNYPQGHFLPFPLAVIDLPAQSVLWTEISLYANLLPDQ